ISKANWMAFTSANCLDSPCPSTASVVSRVGCHTAAFHRRCFPTMRQDPSVNRAYRFSSSGSSLYGGASSARFTSCSSDIPASLLSGQFMIISTNPGGVEVPYSSPLCYQRNPFTPPAPLSQHRSSQVQICSPGLQPKSFRISRNSLRDRDRMVTSGSSSCSRDGPGLIQQCNSNTTNNNSNNNSNSNNNEQSKTSTNTA
ncbi:unnamed protein product, partial [Bubo scandiacus]